MTLEEMLISIRDNPQQLVQINECLGLLICLADKTKSMRTAQKQYHAIRRNGGNSQEAKEINKQARMFEQQVDELLESANYLLEE